MGEGHVFNKDKLNLKISRFNINGLKDINEWDVNEDLYYSRIGENIEEGEILDLIDKVEISENNKKLTIYLKENISYPIKVEYDTVRKGLGEEVYKNKLKIEKDIVISGQADYNNKLIEKSLINKGNVYDGSRINWKVIVNNNLSEFDKLEFKDKISKGLQYIESSIKVSNSNGVELDKNLYDYRFIYTDNDGNEVKNINSNKNSNKNMNNTLIISFLPKNNNELIKEKYIVEYETMVNKNLIEDGSYVENTAEINGIKQEFNEAAKVKIEIKSWSSGIGSGDRVETAKINLRKIDNSDERNIISTSNTIFELYLYVGNSEFKLDDKDWVYVKDIELVNGESIIELREGKYKLIETKAPEGYMLDPTPQYIEVISHKNIGDINNIDNSIIETKSKKDFDIINKKIIGDLNIIKKDKETNENLRNVEFKLISLDENKNENLIMTELITDNMGEIVVKDIVAGNYKLVEVKEKYGYIPLKIEINIVIDNNGNIKLVDESEMVEILDGKIVIYNIKEKTVDKPNKPNEGEERPGYPGENREPRRPISPWKPINKNEEPKIEEPKTEKPDVPKENIEEPNKPDEIDNPQKENEPTEDELIALAKEEARKKKIEEEKKKEAELLALAEEEARRQEEQRRKEELAKAKKLLKTGSKNNIGYMAAGISLIGLGAALSFKKKDK